VSTAVGRENAAQAHATIPPVRYWILFAALLTPSLQSPQPSDWKRFEEETMRHFQALVRFDTSDPPGNEKAAADYLVDALKKEGIPVQTFTLPDQPNRPNVVARLKGSGRKRPLLIMGHTDVVNVDPKKWTHGPFSATRDGGYVYGRGTVDDKDNVTAALMTMVTLKRLNVPLDRDVIFLAEAGEEGSTRVGIQFMVNQHFSEIDAEYCLAEGGGASRREGRVQFASVQTIEKIPHGIELTARGVAGHGSVPLQSNAIAHLAAAVARVAAWKPEIRLNETTRAYFERLATISRPEDAKRYLAIIGTDVKARDAADEYFAEHEPRFASMIRTSLSPNIIQGGYRINVIPSEARATLDVRVHPDDNPAAILEAVRRVVNDPAIEVAWAKRDVRPGSSGAHLDSEEFKAVEAAIKRHYEALALPTMSTGATDMAYLRAKGVQCYGIGPATDIEDAAKGFGGHSDQERILETELHRFVRFHYDLVAELARAPKSR
jgi:acetylornithine deacetylase/succinyl-diaminopimelate desuccinylase-like protein